MPKYWSGIGAIVVLSLLMNGCMSFTANTDVQIGDRYNYNQETKREEVKRKPRISNLRAPTRAFMDPEYDQPRYKGRSQKIRIRRTRVAGVVCGVQTSLLAGYAAFASKGSTGDTKRGYPPTGPYSEDANTRRWTHQILGVTSMSLINTIALFLISENIPRS